jgi:hypothetical protein
MRGCLMGLVVVGENVFRKPSIILLYKVVGHLFD